MCTSFLFHSKAIFSAQISAALNSNGTLVKGHSNQPFVKGLQLWQHHVNFGYSITWGASLPKEPARSAAVELDFLRAMLWMLRLIVATFWSFDTSNPYGFVWILESSVQEAQHRLTLWINNSGKKAKEKERMKEREREAVSDWSNIKYCCPWVFFFFFLFRWFVTGDVLMLDYCYCLLLHTFLACNSLRCRLAAAQEFVER